MFRWTDAEAFRPTYQGRNTPNMGKLIGARDWETLYHGWNWGRRGQRHGLRPRRRQDDGRRSRTSTSTEEDVDVGPPRRIGPVQSPNVLLNQMSDAERSAFVADYNRQGPGRPSGPAAK